MIQGIAERLMTPERYKLYQELEFLRSQLSHPPLFNLGFLEVAAIDPTTREIIDKHEQELDSFTRNYNNVYVSMVCAVNATGSATFGDSHINYKNTAGVIAGSTILPVNPYGLTGAVEDWVIIDEYGNTDHGITAGRGITGWTFEDFVLDVPIAHGAGLNEMLYQTMFNPSQVWDGGPRQWTTILTRYLINRSGSSISVTEVGLQGGIRGAHCLIARDVLGAPVVIDDTKACKITYTFVSAVWPS